MKIRILTIAALLFALTPGWVAGQTRNTPTRLDRFTFQAGAGPLLNSSGYNMSAGVGFSPISRIDLIANVEQDHLPFERQTYAYGYSISRGATLTSLSGEIRASLFPPHRISPYVFAGMGGGISRPTVTAEFPNEIENQLRMICAGAGLRVPIKGGVSVFGDARAMMALEGDEGILGMWPLRAGLSWRF